ncbi:MAG: trypsin-like peptidase domain-containing protein [Terriglobia bacterium]
MANYALIAGIDEYPNAGWRLASAVTDALRFTQWAVGQGGVAPENVRLLLAPTSPLGAEAVFDLAAGTKVSIPILEGTSAALHSVLFKEFRKGWGGGGDRLYVYFAGHGCSHPDVRGEKRPEPVLIFGDVGELPDDYRLLYTFSDILDVLRDFGPKEQFFFLDACRDFALDGVVASGGAGSGRYLRPLSLASGEQAAKQFVIYATAPGGRALEIGRGVFCDALIQGLRGAPGAPRRIAGTGDYELRFQDLFAFVRRQVQRKVAICITDAPRYVQAPEQDPDPSGTDPVLCRFTEEAMGEGELLVRLEPRTARQSTRITVLYEGTPRLPPVGPPVSGPKLLRLKPAWYSIQADAAGFDQLRLPVEVPSDGPVTLTLRTSPAAAPLPAAKHLSLVCRDQRAIVVVIDPAGAPHTAMGMVYFPQPGSGMYRARLLSPEGGGDEHWQVFEFPASNGTVYLDAPYVQPSETLGFIADLKPASLLGFAAYARYTMPEPLMSRLRNFGLEPVPEGRKGEAWLTVLLTAEPAAGQPDVSSILLQSSVAIHYAKSYELGQFKLLAEPAAGAQYLKPVTEGNVTVELRIPELPPTRFPLTCINGRVAVLCVALGQDQSFDIQMYLIPFRPDRMQPGDLRTLEQAQRFYSGSEPMPDPLTEQLVNLKELDPLLGALAGYTFVRQGKPERYRGQPNPALPPGAWNEDSAMQNMLNHFGLLPDSHVLAALCEPDRRYEHFLRALELGVPLFSEGLEVLLAFFASASVELPPGNEALKRNYINLHRVRRSLATGSAFSAWTAFEPALIIERNQFPRPPALWSVLETKRDIILECSKAVGCLRVRWAGGSRDRTAFLIAPDLILTANHAVKEALAEAGWAVAAGASLSFAMADDILSPHGPELGVAEIVAWSADARMAVLRLESPVPDARPLALPPPDIKVKAAQKIFLIGYPFLDDAFDPALIRQVFGDRLGTRRLQPGVILAVPETRNFDHDAFTMKGSAGSPVIDLATGTLLGMHWGGMDEAGFRRGRSIALWKPENVTVLAAVGLAPIIPRTT